jgi:hypothetical protein
MCLSKLQLTPTMNFNLDVQRNERLSFTIAWKKRGFSLAAWGSSFGGFIVLVPRVSPVLDGLKKWPWDIWISIFFAGPARGDLQRSMKWKCSSNEVKMSQNMKRMTSISYWIPIICDISAIVFMNDSWSACSSHHLCYFLCCFPLEVYWTYHPLQNLYFQHLH